MIRALACALLLGGCGPHIPASYPGPPDVTLGTGVDSFVPISDGDSVPIIMGLQGGHHVWGSVRARYVDPQQLHLHFVVTLAGDTVIQAQRDDYVDLDGTSDGLDYGESLGSAVIFTDVDLVRDMPCLFHLDVTDMESRAGTSEKMIVPM